MCSTPIESSFLAIDSLKEKMLSKYPDLLMDHYPLSFFAYFFMNLQNINSFA